MLQHLRDNSKGVVSGILIGLLVVIFALTGAEALFSRDGSTRSIVEVNGEKISEAMIQSAVESQKQQMLSRYGESVPAEFLTEEYLRDPVIENLITRNLLLQAAKRSDLAANTELLDQQILTTPQFQQEDGSFDANKYKFVLRNIGFTPTTYKKALIEDVIVRQLEAGVVNTSFITPTELKDIITLNFQTRDFNYVIIPASGVASSLKVDETEIQAYYNEHTQEFSNPEQVAVDYIELSIDSLLPTIDISEEDIKKQHEQNLAAFVATPEMHAAHILIENNDADVIAEVSAKLLKGEDFANLAEEYSSDLGSKELGGDLGYTTGNTFPDEFEKALSGLKVGEVSAPITTDAGTHFIKKLDEKGVQPPSLEEERLSIASQLKRNEAETIFVDLLEKLREHSYNAESLAEVAEALGLTLQNTGLFSRISGQGMAAQKPFVSAAFSEDVLEQGNSSEVIELTPSHVVVLKKTAYKASFVSDLANVQEDISAKLLALKTQEALTKQAADLAASIKAGKTFTDIAEAIGANIVKMTHVKRNADDVDRVVVNHAFTMPKPQNNIPVLDGVVLNNGDYALLELTSVDLGGEQVPNDQQRIIAAQLSGIIGQDEFKNYQTYLRNTAKIKR